MLVGKYVVGYWKNGGELNKLVRPLGCFMELVQWFCDLGPNKYSFEEEDSKLYLYLTIRYKQS